MQSIEVEIKYKEGIHARPASVFVRQSIRFKSEITLQLGDTYVNGKSIMGILLLALSPGSKVTLTADGVDEKQAIQALAQVLTAIDMNNLQK